MQVSTLGAVSVLPPRKSYRYSAADAATAAAASAVD